MTNRVTNPDLQLGVAPLTCKVLRYNKVKPLLPDAGLELWAAGNESTGWNYLGMEPSHQYL